MKFFISIITIALFAFLLGIYLPWWTVAVAAFAVAVFIRQAPATSFISGFLGVFILWVVLAAFINSSNAGILAGRIGELLGVGKSPAIMILITGSTGGLVAGFSALTASYLRGAKR